VILRVALIGAGAWGTNLARVIASTPHASLTAVVDPDPAALARARQRYASIESVSASLDPALLERVDALVVASPASEHFQAALAGLSAGLAVLVEKPLVKSVDEATRLTHVARERRAVGMVGHLLAHHPAIERAVELVRGGAIGTLQALRGARCGPSDHHESPRSTLWELAPHDLSVAYLLGCRTTSRLRATPTRDADADVDTVTLTGSLEAPGGAIALHTELSRHHPEKVRRLTFEGTSARLVHDDVADPFALTLETASGRERLTVSVDEPLAVEVRRFVQAARDRTAPKTSLEEGAAVVGWIQQAEASRPSVRWTAATTVASGVSGANAVPRPLQAPRGCLPSAGPAGQARVFLAAFSAFLTRP
jgi:UDP-2-acetamido-3-amino-2,3-dideoxy-glucuronate N-acetyltransferase